MAMKNLLLLGLFAVGSVVVNVKGQCLPSVTTASGSHAPKEICSGDIIFEDDFNKLDLAKWQHENTLAGGGNWEFQWYTNNRTSTFVKNGNLVIKPIFTSDQMGESFLTSGTLDLNGGAPADWCTNAANFGCIRAGNPTNIINPIKSGRLRTVDTFRFKYGKVQVRAKLPAGDWIWPAIWMMPAFNTYGSWPASGEIDIMESRGNRDMKVNGVNIGVEQVASTLHFGPDWSQNAYEKTSTTKNTAAGDGYNKRFSVYEVEWTPDYLHFKVDNVTITKIQPSDKGFWEFGGFNPAYQNPWESGTKMAPFDQEFYIIFNVAIGGTNGFFPDAVENPKPKPWLNTSPKAATDFWDKRSDWLPTWSGPNDEASLQIDSIKVFAL